MPTQRWGVLPARRFHEHVLYCVMESKGVEAHGSRATPWQNDATFLPIYLSNILMYIITASGFCTIYPAQR